MDAPNAHQRIAGGDNLTPKQTAALLNLPEATLAVWRSTNRVVLPFFKLGHHVRYRRSDIERFIEANLRNAPGGPA
jgi:excisionase family DNA binding protein